MTPVAWPCPLPDGGISEEFALAFDSDRRHRLLVVPALFDEGNRMRRLTVETLRRLDRAGIDGFLPDLPGCNESLRPLDEQTPGDWQDAMAAAAEHFGATHVLAIRGGGLVAPPGLPGFHYASAKGANLLRQLIRARIVAQREAGIAETQEGLLETAAREGIELTGHRFRAEFIKQLQSLVPIVSDDVRQISQEDIGGGGLWLRAEPDEDREQADALAAIVAIGIAA